jgi:NAD(P)H-dependent flavin oxidoreductase YrpB (nitropropane dioxygenase family)
MNINSVTISGFEALPIIEGGKGIGASNGESCGAFAATGAVGTFSGVNPDSYDPVTNKRVPYIYKGTTRKERHDELINFSIQGGITQARIAHEVSGGKGPIHMNVLWEMGGVSRILHGVLEGAKGLIHGITCGAGMPFKLGEIAAKFGVHYYPIVSSARAFKLLWMRAYRKWEEQLGGVVYEDPWKAGGHNGLSNAENPEIPEDPYPRVVEIRKYMNEVGLHRVPIIMAGGVWHLKDWEKWLDNPEIGPIAFQFGTRPLLTTESPIPDSWKKRLLTLKKGDIFLNKFSPTGFYSSAVRNDFIEELAARSNRQVEYRTSPEGEFTLPIPFGARNRPIYIKAVDAENVDKWKAQGFTESMKTPDSTVIFVAPEKAAQIHHDQVECMGCLSHCNFSNWKDHDEFTTGHKPDPRSYCIQKTLQEIIHDGDTENQLMFAGHNAYKFADDPYYNNGFIPTVKQLVERIMTGR